MKEIQLIAGMFAVTFGVRYLVLALASRIRLPDIIARGLKFVPAAVLSAIIFPAVLIPGGEQIEFSTTNAYLVAGTAAALVSLRTKNLLATILIGMALFLLLRWLIG